MGNQTDYKQPTSEHLGDDILHNEYIIPCQICGQNIKHSQFKVHLDQYHYAEIEEVNNSIQVKCLLCDEQCDSLDKHGKHINKKHSYAASLKSIKAVPLLVVEGVGAHQRLADQQWNKRKKQSISRLKGENDYQIIKKNEDSGFTAQLNSEIYSVDTITKEYRGSDYEPNQVLAELIWFNIFKSSKDYIFYWLDEQPKQKSILCKAYFFYANTK